MELAKIISILQYPEPIAEAIKQNIFSSAIPILAKNAYANESGFFPITKMPPFERLVVVTFLLSEKYDNYVRLGVPEEIIEDTFRDVAHRARIYFERYSAVGLSTDDVVWFRHIMNIEIFQLGPLQFQSFKMIYLDEETIGEPYMVFSQAQKQQLIPGTPVINCHIPKGTSLQPEVVRDSFRCAIKLFEKVFPNLKFEAFLCYSWLLYPKMTAYLPSNSNIREFAGLFSIIGYCSDNAQALEFLHTATSLHRIAIAQPEILGFACGIIPIDHASENQ